jgi:hypothetical protein
MDNKSKAKAFLRVIISKLPIAKNGNISEQRVLAIFESIVANIDDKNDKAIKREIVNNVEEYYNLFSDLLKSSRKESEEEKSNESNKPEASIAVKASKSRRSSAKKRSFDEINMKKLKDLYELGQNPSVQSISEIIDKFINQTQSSSTNLITVALLEQQSFSHQDFLASPIAMQLCKCVLLKLYFSDDRYSSVAKSYLGAFAVVSLFSMNRGADVAVSNLLLSVVVSLEFMDSLYLMGFLGHWVHRFPKATHAQAESVQWISKLIKVAISRYNQDQSKKAYDVDHLSISMLCLLSSYLVLTTTSEKQVTLDLLSLAVMIKGSQRIDFNTLLNLEEDFIDKEERNLFKLFQKISEHADGKKLVSDKLMNMLLPKGIESQISNPFDDTPSENNYYFEVPGSVEEAQDEDLFVIDRDGDKSLLDSLPTSDENTNIEDLLQQDVKASIETFEKTKVKKARTK